MHSSQPHRYALTFSYHGKEFVGWQEQPNLPTVQGRLTEVLSQLFDQPVVVVGSSRTDSGVHALAQVAHFDVHGERALWPKEQDFLYRLNRILNPKIWIQSCKKVANNFHSILDVKSKKYSYFIWNSPYEFPWFADVSWFVPQYVDVSRLQKILEPMIGEHDFKSFCAADTETATTVRTILNIQVAEPSAPPFMLPFSPSLFRNNKGSGKMICVEIVGTGFLKQMVRNLVGTAVQLTINGSDVDTMTKFLNVKDRRAAGLCAPPQGLFLQGIVF